MLDKIKQFINSEGIRYIIVGACTTLVNLVTFSILCYLTPLGDTDMGITVSNIISIASAILFAYVTNKIFVFHSRTNTVRDLAVEFIKFVGARLGTMALEVGGVWFTVSLLNQNEMIGKLETQVFVLVSNYFISKFFVFKSKKTDDTQKGLDDK